MHTALRPRGGTFVDILRDRADGTPDRTAFEFLTDSGELVLSYADIDRRARAVAAALSGRGLTGERALLLYPPGVDYVVGFLGCLYAGVVAVPVHLPTGRHGVPMVLAAATDAGAVLALSDRATATALDAQYPELAATAFPAWLLTDELPAGLAETWDGRGPRPDALAFLQYTSGSTGRPKGVMVRHGNLVHNSATIGQAVGSGPDSRGVSWLPPYHDMGLIGGILQPLYAGFPSVLMAPMTFLRRPLLWLDAISRTRATVSAAPDFAYLECVRRIGEEDRACLDLSSWRHAMMGAEPVRPSTMAAFAAAFEVSGFSPRAFHPCYGLAETTLFATGGPTRGGAPRVLDLSRDALERGRAEAAGPDTGPRLSLTGCGTPQGEDLVLVVADGRPCAQGEVGEVWISGPSVAAGYWERPEETSRTFHATLDAHPGCTFLRTGDLAFTSEGELFITGRIKDLMVVRGRNHYPQDIEQTAERAHPLLQPTRSAAFSVDDGGEEQVVLVHEVARGFTPDDAPGVLAAVREAVAAEHGLAPREIALVRLGTIPRTTSGKIRRSTCRELWASDGLKRVAAAAPRATTTPAQGASGSSAPAAAGSAAPSAFTESVTEAVAAVLGTPAAELDRAVPLIALGLDSLRAVRLAAALHRSTGAEVPVERLLDGLTTGELADRLDGWRAAEATDAADGVARTDGVVRTDGAVLTDGDVLTDAGAPVRAGRAQEWMWLLAEMGAGSAYHITGGVRLRGPVEPGLLTGCLSALVARHPTLRAAFHPTPDGTLMVTARPAEPLGIEVVDVSAEPGPAAREEACRAALTALGDAPFDLASGSLLRAVLVRLAADEWCLGLVAHHIAVDGWSLGVLLRELGAAYKDALAGRPSPAPLPSPRPYVYEAEEAAAAEAFWSGVLDGAAALELPLDVPQPGSQSWRGASLPFEVGAEQVTRLRSYGSARRATPYMVLLSAFATVLSRWTGQHDVVVGTPAACRTRPGTAEALGLFVNTLPLRVDLSGAPTFGELVGRVRDLCLAAYPYQDYPYDEMVRLAGAERSGGRPPLVRAALALQNTPLAAWQAGEVHAEPFELPSPGAQFEISLHLTEQPDGRLAGHVVYAADLFTEDTVRRLLDAFATVLDAAPRLPGAVAADLPVLPEADLRWIVEELSGARGAEAPPALLHQAFEARADRDPTVLAVVDEEGRLTYGELEERANRIAWLLRDLGIGPDQAVAICLPRGTELVAALLGVLKSGGGYLPLDPGYPASRLAAQVADVRPAVLLTTGDLATGLLADVVAADTGTADGSPAHASPAHAGPAHAGPADGSPVLAGPVVVRLDEGAADDRPTTRPAPVSSPRNMAYVLHTSGSTGRPKGVVMEHAGVVNRMDWMRRAHHLAPGETVLQKTPVGFDVSGWELWWPLSAGGTMVLARPGGHQDPTYLAELIRRESVATCHFVPSMLRSFLEEPAARECAGVLRRVVCSGEELPPAVAARFHTLLPGVELHNMYGPTEAAIEVTAYEVKPGDTDRVRLPIGGPAPGVRLYVLDERGRPLPVGVPGELHIGGVQVARGYLGRPGLTAERFVPDPYADGGRLYRTGDRARWSADGTIDFLGRLDGQVKIRGHRVEPAEVEAVLGGHPALAEVAVVVRTVADEPALVGYLVAAGDEIPSGELRAHLAERLPAAMIPSAFVWLAELPTGANGKLDRGLLPEPGRRRESAAVAPRDAVEREVARIWSEVLGLPEVSVNDDLFTLGGHSLQATRIVVRVRSAFGLELPLAGLISGELTVERIADAARTGRIEPADDEEVERALAELASLTDAEVAALLAEG
ncbi:amino acid adenylation domain-containing protein [Streptomyces sp. ISL-36]|uniref:non-ribosomal peptide synthetase n=1 Tax=Streptomyces sp. ISL-36 TaxID=2819182 RepID=UPI001BEA2B87|nr:non-ribosomal peptide synthetase [Streptomyces sp. ISL-36]MBT2440934.1 amino acid adenylation domain-containing protein [Streptomyces sp. ISL-36]